MSIAALTLSAEAAHGITKLISKTFERHGSEAKAKFGLKLSDFRVEILKYAGVTVAENVQIEADLNDIKVQ